MLGGIYKGRPVTLGYVKIIDLHQGTDSQEIAMGMHLLVVYTSVLSQNNLASQNRTPAADAHPWCRAFRVFSRAGL